MDPITCRPIECFHQVLQILTQQNLVSALAVLLHVNKYIASITLPFLYDKPFRGASHSKRIKNQSQVFPQDIVLRTLLGCHTAADVPKIVSLILDIPSCRPMSTPLDYSAHIRHRCLRSWAYSSESLIVLSPETVEYIKGPEFACVCCGGNTSQ